MILFSSSLFSFLSCPFSSPSVSFTSGIFVHFCFLYALFSLFVLCFAFCFVLLLFMIIISLRYLLSVSSLDSFCLLFIPTLLFYFRSEFVFFLFAFLFNRYLFSWSLSFLNRSSLCIFGQNIMFSL
jgi:hypothetical protein